MGLSAKKITVARQKAKNPVALRLVVNSNAEPAPRVMILDDEHEFREVLAQLLGGWGFRVDMFDAGSRALEFLRVGPKPDIVLLDLLLRPDMNGWQFLELFRKEPRLQGIPVITMSAGAMGPSELEKPFEPQTLRAHLARYGIVAKASES